MRTLDMTAFSDGGGVRVSSSPRDDDGRGALTVCFALAAAVHLAFAWGAPVEGPVARAVAVTEAALLPPERVEAPPPPPITEPAAHDTAPARHVARPAGRPAPPMAARAGALLTAKPDATKASAQEEPVDFVTDPSGKSYGGGTVMRGGTADFGAVGAVAGGASAAPSQPGLASGDGLTAAVDLSRAARLDEPDACRGYYPSEAVVDAGSAVVTVVVRPGGAVTRAVLLSETPAGQGFGRAARSCLQSKRFAPAIDKRGVEVSSAATIHVRFSR